MDTAYDVLDTVPIALRGPDDLGHVSMDGCVVHLADAEHAALLISRAADRHRRAPLAVVSINLDHIHHYGASRRRARGLAPFDGGDRVEWLNLIDGAPIATRAGRLTGVVQPKLSGSDLIAPVLDSASVRGRSVGVVGGMPEVRGPLREALAARWPALRLAGHWTPSRDELGDAEANERLAAEIREADVDILLVCLGKPRQEQWMAEWGAETGAGALLAFGAVVDFLAGRVSRAPRLVSRLGLEWAWRLLLEPRRLARRYLVQGPPAYAALRRA